MSRSFVDAKAFSRTLNLVSRAATKAAFVPELEGVLIQFDDTSCTLTAGNLETFVVKSIVARNGDRFSFVLPKPKEVARACSRFEGELSVEYTKTGEGRMMRRLLLLRCGQRAFEVDVLGTKDYPELPRIEAKSVYTVNATALLERVNRVRYAHRKVETDDHFERVCVQLKGDCVYATDGYRAACDKDAGFLFPAPFMARGGDLAYLDLFGEHEVEIRIGDFKTQITDGATSLFCRSRRVEFTNLEAAIPSRFQEVFQVAPKEFLAELAYLKELSMQKERGPLVRFCGGDLQVKSNFGDCRTRIRTDGTGQMTIGFDLRKMTDALQQFRGESMVRMKLSSPVGPIIIEADGRSDYAMVLPVNLKAEQAA